MTQARPDDPWGGEKGLPPLTPPLLRQRWNQAQAAAAAPFADPSRTAVMLPALAPLLDAGATVRFSTHTGLVRTLRGRLWEPRVTNVEQAIAEAEAFLNQSQPALFGSAGERWARAWRPMVGSAACFQQTSRDGIPVYGAAVACDYDPSGRIRMLTSSWYPLPADLPAREKLRLPQEQALAVAVEAVKALLAAELERQSDREEFSRLRAAYEETVAGLKPVPGQGFEDGRVIAPVLSWKSDDGESAPTGAYRAAWLVRVLDRRFRRSWEVLVAGEDETRGDIVGLAPAAYEISIFQTNDDVPGVPTQVQPNTIDLPNVLPALNAADQRQSNVYYHLTRAAEIFEASALVAWPVPPRSLESLPGRVNGRQLTVDTAGLSTAWYDPGDIRNLNDGALSFGPGQSAPPVRNPALDREVIFHEYAHAVIDTLQPGIADKIQPEPFRRALDEGLAFYFGCSLSERPPNDRSAPSRWGDFSYGHNLWQSSAARELERPVARQAAGFDYLSIYGSFPRYANLSASEPTSEPHYACGMAWARALWDVRRVLGFEQADALILRSLPLVSGVQTDLETAAEAIIHADEALNGGVADGHESALRVIFCSRGIAADAPVHDLQAITIGGQPCLLAAVERHSGETGCVISLDGGDTWQVLGQNGPASIGTLAAVQLDANRAAVLAAGEGPPGGGPPLVYQYMLQFANGTITLDSSWSQLPSAGQLPGSLATSGILTLAAMPQPSNNARIWVFAGAERGVYKHDGAGWVEIANVSANAAIRNLALLTPGGVPILLAAGQQGTFAIDAATLARRPDLEAGLPTRETLAVAVAPAGGSNEAWAGTWDGQVVRFNPQQAVWANHSMLPGRRPVYCLLPETAGGQVVLYAGTSDSVWRFPDDQGAARWQQIAGTNDANFVGCATIALASAGQRLFAGTLQRGLWRRAPGAVWERLANGLPRIGRLGDAETSGAGGQIAFARNTPLAKGRTATHVLDLSTTRVSLNATLQTDALATLTVFYAAPYTDLGHMPPFGAGLVQVAQSNGAVLLNNSAPGSYLFAVTARDTLNGYQLDIALV
jgi:hypothetical protein